jgi:PRC-barrel domain
MNLEHQEASRLCYLSPAQVEGPLPTGRLDVFDRDDRRIGEFAGVILDPEARRLRYLVLKVAGLFKHRRYLVPIDPTQIDAEHRSLRVGIERAALAACAIFDPGAFRIFPAKS